LGEIALGLDHVAQRARTRAQMRVRIGQVGPLADHAELQVAPEPVLADAGVEHRRLKARIGPDEQKRVALVQPSYAGVEQPAFARTGPDPRAVLAAVEVLDAKAAEQVQRRLHGFRVLQVAGDHADAVGRGGLDLRRHRREGLRPGRGLKLAAFAHVRPVQPLAHQAVAGIAGLVGDPLLVDLVIGARQDAHHLVGARIDADGAAHGFHHVNALGLGQLPGPGLESVGLGGQSANGAEVDDIAGKLAGHRLLEIGGDLDVLAATDQTDLRLAGDFADEAHAAGALDAAGHHRLDQWTHELFFDGALVLHIAGGVAAETHRLVLQVALAALVADRAVQRVVDEQELHHPFARLLDHR